MLRSLYTSPPLSLSVYMYLSMSTVLIHFILTSLSLSRSLRRPHPSEIGFLVPPPSAPSRLRPLHCSQRARGHRADVGSPDGVALGPNLLLLVAAGAAIAMCRIAPILRSSFRFWLLIGVCRGPRLQSASPGGRGRLFSGAICRSAPVCALTSRGPRPSTLGPDRQSRPSSAPWPHVRGRSPRQSTLEQYQQTARAPVLAVRDMDFRKS